MDEGEAGFVQAACGWHCVRARDSEGTFAVQHSPNIMAFCCCYDVDPMLTWKQNASGKILKRILRDQAKKEMAAKL